MSVEWSKVAECFEDDAKGYRLVNRLKRELGDDESLHAMALWMGYDRELWSPTDSSELWVLAKFIPEGWCAEDLVTLLGEMIEAKAEPLTSDRSYNVEIFPGWHSGLDPLVSGVKDPQALAGSWQGFPEPLRTGMASALVRMGVLPAGDVPAETVTEIGNRVARYCSGYQAEDQRIKDLWTAWPAKQWAHAMASPWFEPQGDVSERPHVKLELFASVMDALTPQEVVTLGMKVESYKAQEAADAFAKLDGARPLLEAEAQKILNALSNGQYPYHECTVLVCSLWPLLSAAAQAWPEAYDPLLDGAVRSRGNHYELLVTIIKTLPKDRRAVVLKYADESMQSISRWGSGGDAMVLLEALPTEEVITSVLAKLGTLPKELYDSTQKTFLNLLKSFGPAAKGPLIRALGGRGKMPLRHVAYEALAELADPEAIATLLEGAGDAKTDTSNAAVAGLKRFEWATLEAPLKAALGARKKDTRMGAAGLLLELPMTEASKALAADRLSKEKVAGVKQLLEQIIEAPLGGDDKGAATGASPVLEALEALGEDVLAKAHEAVAQYMGNGVNLYQEDQRAPFFEFVSTLSDDSLTSVLMVSNWFSVHDSYVPLEVAKTLFEPHKDAPLTPFMALELWLRASLGNLDDGLNAWAEHFGTERSHEAARFYLGTERFEGRDHQYRYLEEIMAPHMPEVVVPVWVEALAGKDRYRREDVQRKLVAVADVAVPFVVKSLKHRQAGVRQRVANWLTAHGTPEAQEALADALGREKNKKTREAIATALAACTPLEVIIEGATAQTDAALDAALCGTPTASADAPSGVDAQVLASVCWASGQTLSEGAQRWILVSLSRETADQSNDGLWRLRHRLDAATAEAAVEGLLKTLGNNNDARAFGIYAQALLGDETRIETLGEPLDEMARNNASTWAFHRLAALTRRCSPVALYWVDTWAGAAKSKGLRARAEKAAAELAKAQNTTLEALMSQARPPRHGFDDQGQRQIQAGSHTLTLTLSPKGMEAQDASGKTISWRSLSRKVGKAAAAAPKALREAVDRSLSLVVATLERAMVSGQRWSLDAWTELFVDHPVAAACVRGVIFEATGDSAEPTLFTIEADGAQNKVDGQALGKLPDGALIGIPHRLGWDDAVVDAWVDRLRGLSLEQPFEQLERSVYTFDPAIKRPFKDAVKNGSASSPSAFGRKVVGLGYQRGAVEDAGFFYSFHRRLPEGHKAIINHSGLSVEGRYQPDEFEVSGFFVQGQDGNACDEANLPALIFSEAMRDLDLFLL